MDFVQRNLINERNNLQVELAKAKILIAQLSEGKIKIPFTNKSISWGKEGELLKQADAKLAELRKQQDAAAKSPPKGSRSWPIGEYSYPDSAGTKNEVYEQAEYISSLENVIVALAESMNMSVEDLLNEGEMRNRRLAGALNKAGDNVRIGKTRLDAMDSHVSNVAKTQGSGAGLAADLAVSRLRGPTERSVRDALQKNQNVEARLQTGMAAVERSRASRVARGSFSNKPKEQAQADRIRNIGGGIKVSGTALHIKEIPGTYSSPYGKQVVTGGAVAKVGSTSSASLAAQGKLPTKKFGTGADQKTNFAAMQTDSAAKREDRAAIQSYAQKARNQANKPV